MACKACCISEKAGEVLLRCNMGAIEVNREEDIAAFGTILGGLCINSHPICSGSWVLYKYSPW